MGDIDEAVSEYRKALTLNLTEDSSGSVRQLLKYALSEETEDSVKRREYWTRRVTDWRAAVEQHTPGESDEAAVMVGSWPISDLEVLVQLVRSLRGCAKINSHFGASAGRADARRRDAGNVVHCRGAATPQTPARRRAPKGGRLLDMQYAIKVSIEYSHTKRAGRKM